MWSVIVVCGSAVLQHCPALAASPPLLDMGMLTNFVPQTAKKVPLNFRPKLQVFSCFLNRADIHEKVAKTS